jgi:hypothetical protein
MKIILLGVMLFLIGCSRVVPTADIRTAEKKCEALGGLKSITVNTDVERLLDGTCVDGTKIEFRVPYRIE